MRSLLHFLSVVHSLSSPVVADNCVGLSFSGGGAFGAVEIGILARMWEAGHIPESIDILAGISAGGLNAGFLSSSMASGRSMSESIKTLHAVYDSLTNDKVYSFNPFKSAKSWSLYQTTPLNATIADTLTSLATDSPTNIRTLVGTTNLHSGLLEIVKYEELQSLSEKVALLMATSAIPIVFPPIAWNGSLYVDGGLITNELVYQAIAAFPERCVSESNISLWYFQPTINIESVSKLPTFHAYISRLMNVVANGFLNQLQKLVSPDTECMHGQKEVQLWLCNPNEDGIARMSEYSVLEFGHGDDLFQIGYDTGQCTEWRLCLP